MHTLKGITELYFWYVIQCHGPCLWSRENGYVLDRNGSIKVW